MDSRSAGASHPLGLHSEPASRYHQRIYARAAAQSRKEREEQLRLKRICRDPSAAEGTLLSNVAVFAEAASDAEAVKASVLAAVAALDAVRVPGSSEHIAALRKLRQIFSADGYSAADAALRVLDKTGDEKGNESGRGIRVLRLLTEALQLRTESSSVEMATAAALEAAWALTNIAACALPVPVDLLQVVPALVVHLASAHSPELANQCAWAIGNLAGEGAPTRSVLIFQVLQPLAGLAVSPAVGGDTSPPACRAAATAAWGLSNLLRDAPSSQVGQLLGSKGWVEALLRLVANAPDPALASEAAWVLTYLSAAEAGHLRRLAEAGAVNAVLERLLPATATREAVEAADRAVVAPLLRTLGNLAAAGDPPLLTSLLAAHQGRAVPTLLRCMESSHRGIAKEAAWAVSNLAGAPGRAGCEAVLKAGGGPVIVTTLKDGAFDIRKEAAFALANLCAGGGGGRGEPATLTQLVGNDPDALRTMLDLIRSVDMEAAALGLEFAEMVLQVMPGGRTALEAADGIDAIESVEYRGPSELQLYAIQLVDKYFGADYDGDMAAS